MNRLFRWGRLIVLTLIAIFFLIFGIQILVAAYRLENPFYFLLTFFASNFMILISATLILGFGYRMWGLYKGADPPAEREPDETEDPES